ncbi:MAG: Na-K-Cl cotransporter, partial [Salinimicrobium sp.]
TVLGSPHITRDRVKKMEQNIQDFLAKRSTRGFARVITARDTFKGIEDFVKAYGLGSLVPNTIILGDSENEQLRKQYCHMIKNFYDLNRNVIILRENEEKGFGKRKKIDLWWGGLKGNGGLLMLISYLLKSSRSWYDAQVTLKMVVQDEKAAADAQENLLGVIKKLRTGAKLDVIISKSRSFDELLHESSSDADLICLGMAIPDENFEAYYSRMQQRLKGLPTSILVLAAEEISFGEVLMQQDSFRKE